MENGKRSTRARVFVSCGQDKSSGEVTVASEIRDRLYELGYDPYIAVREQTLRGLKENVFGQLSNSEYFVFVDFKRELLVPSEATHRGSLFCHQELAIAAYLDIPVLAFQEAGVKADDGILRFIQANAIQFRDRHLLSSVIADEVSKRKEIWDPYWRNELVLEREPQQYSRTLLDGRWSRFFHVNVRNHHRRKTARNCCAYLERITQVGQRTEIPAKQVEFVWAGYGQPNAHIFAGKSRPFDGFFIFEDAPLELRFNVFATATDFVPRVAGEGTYDMEYTVVAENFPDVSATLTLNLNASPDATAFSLNAR